MLWKKTKKADTTCRNFTFSPCNCGLFQLKTLVLRWVSFYRGHKHWITIVWRLQVPCSKGPEGKKRRHCQGRVIDLNSNVIGLLFHDGEREKYVCMPNNLIWCLFKWQLDTFINLVWKKHGGQGLRALGPVSRQVAELPAKDVGWVVDGGDRSAAAVGHCFSFLKNDFLKKEILIRILWKSKFSQLEEGTVQCEMPWESSQGRTPSRCWEWSPFSPPSGISQCHTQSRQTVDEVV